MENRTNNLSGRSASIAGRADRRVTEVRLGPWAMASSYPRLWVGD